MYEFRKLNPTRLNPAPATCLGACTMTTKFLNNKICTFIILLSWHFPRKQALLDDSPLCPKAPPLKSENFIFIVVSPSLQHATSEIRSCAAVCGKLRTEVALQHSLFCNADVVFPKSCAAAGEKLQSKIEKAALQESGRFPVALLQISGSHV